MANAKESFTFTVGKLDAGMAILIGERAHLIEFPSLLLPNGVTSGSIVNIAVHRNFAEEERQRKEFWDLQRDIYRTFGVATPKPPKLELRNITQTSVTLEWPPLQLATAKLRSLDIYKNNQRLASIPSPLQNTSTKLSGLEVNHEFTFHLVLRTSAGTFQSNVIRTRTHTMSDTSGISVCFGTVEDPALLEEAKEALKEMRARWSEKIQIETTHFVCTTPSVTPQASKAAGTSPAPSTGVEYQKALGLSIPVVHPHWILACHQEKKMVPISGFYLGANTPPAPGSYSRPTSLSQGPSSPNVSKQAPRRSSTTPAPTGQARQTPPSGQSTFVNQSAVPSPAPASALNTHPSELEEEDEEGEEVGSKSKSPRPTNGILKKEFKFPNTSRTPPPPLPPAKEPELEEEVVTVVKEEPSRVAAEIPPPTPVEKEKGKIEVIDGDEEVGETVEVDLS